MIKLAFCLRRRAGLSREEFQRYWLDEHGSLVRQHARTLRIRRYVQLHTEDHALNVALRNSRGGPEAFDGSRFIDLERSPLFLAREHELVAAERGDGGAA